ncbi:MAG: sigma-70 family RNA polymerase sigma factor [Lachnospiraceae bacterium]|nr:sigma-70 family RNA polymerase sigma factor [Lachnospiraceae bacterium]
MEDNKIIDLFFKRSEQAISELSAKYGRLCEKIARNILNNASDAEECVNDTYLGVWNSIPPNHPDSLSAYVCRIARNLSLKRYQYNTASKRNSIYDTALEELEECIASAKDMEGEVESAELTKTIEQFLDTLSESDRVIFMRRYYFSDSYADIALQTSLTEKNVSVRLTRLRSKLRNYLKERDYII